MTKNIKEKESSHPLGAPWRQSDRDDFETSIIERHSWDKDGGIDRAVEYVYKIADRQINKARRLLTYDALLFGAFKIVRPANGAVPIFVTIGALTALASCFPLLFLMYVAWGTGSDWRKSENDFHAICSLIYRRSYFLTAALVISLIATCIAVIEVLTA